uniref:Chromo domain-containing protein n=1 Tax=Parastrongyloides trichosuri TaxID=131310 RepID=A0A0N4Z1M1_PARTI
MSSDSEEYIVEDIVDKKIGRKGIIYYKIKWQGYSDRDNTWEPESNLDESLVKRYEKCRLLKKKFIASNDSDEEEYDDKKSKRKCEDNLTCKSNVKNEEGFLMKLLKNYNNKMLDKDDINFIIGKHFNDKGEEFYLIQLKNMELIYAKGKDIPVICKPN